LDHQVGIPKGVSWEVLVVDNGSSDATPEVVAALREDSRPWLRYTVEPRPGKSFALNRGIRESEGNILAFTDDDVRIDPNWLASIGEVFSRSQYAGIGGRVVPDWDCPRPAWLRLDGPRRLMSVIPSFDLGEEPVQLSMATSLPAGANVAFRREVFEQQGGYRTDLGPRQVRSLRTGGLLGEDTEFALRVLSAGVTMVYVPDAVVHHPAAPERMTKRYYRHWYYDDGRSQICRHGLAEGTTVWFRIPRHLLRELVESSMKWLVHFASRDRFYFELQIWLTAGRIVEARRVFNSR
jgi:glycosyltransferase involved in cell wall biosynthesis